MGFSEEIKKLKFKDDIMWDTVKLMGTPLTRPIKRANVSSIVPPDGGTWQEFVGGLDDAATPPKYNHHWS